jgi:serine/threonine protein kinase
MRATWAGTSVVVKHAIRPIFLKMEGTEPQEDEDEERNLDETAALELEFVHEVQMLREMRHPNIVLFMGVTFGEKDPGTGQRAMYIVQELVRGGSLVNILQLKEKRITWGARIKMALEIAGAISYMHDRNMLHRDLKCENILLETLSSSSLTTEETLANLRDTSQEISAESNTVRCKVAEYVFCVLFPSSSPVVACLTTFFFNVL